MLNRCVLWVSFSLSGYSFGCDVTSVPSVDPITVFESARYEFHLLVDAETLPSWDGKSTPPLSIEDARNIAKSYVDENPISILETVLYSVRFEQLACDGMIVPVYVMQFMTVKDRLPQQKFPAIVFMDGKLTLPAKAQVKKLINNN